MHIEEIILDGFKSYPFKTTIGPFHPQFNSITGLNGSGKSNVLDAICFVMGINNLNMIRVNRLEELIYKQGQAGITKGSVSIKFNNEDFPSPLQEPYKDMKYITITRQIALGGRNRYLLNSHNAKQKEIADFFQSLKLNINNPHFLIMQGKITKVINMKPLEILGLIEECSGTKLYEVKRANALKLMDKKDYKLKEIDKILINEIEPALSKLRNEKAEYNKYINNEEEIEHLEKIQIAYKYYHAKNKSIDSEKQIEQINNDCMMLDKELKEIDIDLKQKKDRRDQILSESVVFSEPLKNLTDKKSQTEKDITRALSQKEETNKEYERQKKKKEHLLSEYEQIEKKLLNYEKNDSEDKLEIENLEKLNKNIEELKEELRDKQLLLNCMGKGTTNDQDNESAGSLREQLKNYKSELSKIESEINIILQNNKEWQKEILTLHKKKKDTEEEDDDDIYKINKEKEEVEEKKKEIEGQIDMLNKKFNFTQMDEYQRKIDKLNNEMEQIKREIQIFNNMLSSIRIDYKIPDNMKSSDVLGQIYKLVRIKREYKNTMLAVHLIVGKKFSYILVNNKDNTKKLFEFNNFSRGNKRVTLLPLADCLIGRNISQRDIDDLKNSIGLNKNDQSVIYYRDIMECNKGLDKVINYLFNGTIICTNSEICKQITFNKNKRHAYPTITLEGDKFDTSGFMSGGSIQNMNYLLLTYEKLIDKENEYNEKDKEIKKLNEDLIKVLTSFETKKKLERELQIYIVNLKNIEDRIKYIENGNTNCKIKSLEEEIEKGRDNVSKLYEEQKRITNSVYKIEKDIADFEKDKEKKENELKKTVTKLKAKIKEKEEEYRTKKDEMNNVIKNIENLKKQIDTQKNETELVSTLLLTLQEKITQIEEEIQANQKNLQNIEKEMDELRLNSSFYEKELQILIEEIKVLENKKSNYNLELKKLKHDLVDLNNTLNDSLSIVRNLKKNHVWITSQEDQFNEKNTPFYFKNINLTEIKQKLESLYAMQQKLSTQINRKAIPMFDTVEKDYEDLVTKKNQVEKDKIKIREVIRDLDVRKKESLLNMFKQVNQNFQAIFSTLLIGAQAKLSPLSEDLSKGIEMKIAFSNKWKESLTELSGGQRSLLALSLILALLKVRTVPMYILDEIDAALDLNHTENIGDMIRTQFPQSQFIIVSLKEGMFSHADVLFKMSFQDGISIVSRHTLDVREIKIKNDKKYEENKIEINIIEEKANEINKKKNGKLYKKNKRKYSSKKKDENENEDEIEYENEDENENEYKDEDYEE